MPIKSPDQPVTKKVKLDLSGLDPANKARARAEAGSIIVSETQSYLDRSSSPVEGGAFKTTLATGVPSKLFETGAMRFNISFEEDEDSIEVGVFSSDQTAKAYAHNTGFKGHPTLESSKLRRQFIPSTNKRYKQDIMDKVNDRIESIRATQPVTVGELLDAIDGLRGENL